MSNTAHYHGDCTDFDPDSFVGRDTAGAFYRPIEATYDTEADRTTIKYRPVPPAEMPARYGHLVEQAEDRAALVDLFGGSY